MDSKYFTILDERIKEGIADRRLTPKSCSAAFERGVKNLRRQDIIDIYEVLYSELSQSWAGVNDAYKEAVAETEQKRRQSESQTAEINRLKEEANEWWKKFNALLTLLVLATDRQDPEDWIS